MGLNGPTRDLPLAAAWEGHRFRSLYLHDFPDIDAAVLHFANSHDRLWSMRISQGDSVKYTLHAGQPDAPDAIETIAISSSYFHKVSDVAGNILRTSQAQTLGRLVSLWISSEFFFPLVHTGSHLPVLTALVVNMASCLLHSGHGDRRTRGSLNLPLLRMFTAAYPPGARLRADEKEWLFVVLPENLSSWLKYDSDRLKLVSLGAELKGRFDMVTEEGKRRLERLAEQVDVPVGLHTP